MTYLSTWYAERSKKMPKKRTFYSEEERKAHHEKKQREADLQIQELTKHWENDPKDVA